MVSPTRHAVGADFRASHASGEDMKNLSSPPGHAGLYPEDGAGLPALTLMQTRVLRLVRSGLANRDIASELEISEATVKIHMTALMRRLNVCNRTQVALVAAGELQRAGHLSAG